MSIHAEALCDAEARIRRRPPKAQRDFEKAVVLAFLETQGWKDYTATPTAQCPRCALTVQ